MEAWLGPATGSIGSDATRTQQAAGADTRRVNRQPLAVERWIA